MLSIDPSNTVMEHNRLVRVTLGDREIDVPYRTPVGAVLTEHNRQPNPVLAAIVHNRCVDLSFPICSPTTIQPVEYTMREGVLVYRRTASLILFEAARQLWPDMRVCVGQAMGNGYFYDIHSEEPFTQEQMDALRERMDAIVAADLPLCTETVSLGEAIALFEARGFTDKKLLLSTYWEPFVTLVRLGEFCDIHHQPVAPRTGFIRTYQLVHYPPGLILRFAPRGRPQTIRTFQDTPRLFQVYRETREWNTILGVENVGQLNALIMKGEAGQIIRVAEGLHEKKIAMVAEAVRQRRDRVKLVLIAGPSSSGKTTFSQRLSLQLRVSGLYPVALSTDNFYVDRDKTPRDSQGRLDFEAIEAIDLDLFNQVLVALMSGERVLTPRFDFQTGKRVPMERWTPMQLAPGQLLVVEGIHGLNDRLTEAVPTEQKFKIYVSALTQLCIDDHNRIFTSDTRFLRRIVRDRLFRGYSAEQTIANWPSVRRGEQKNIFPFQEQADVMFNSALVYEQAVLRLYAERYLYEVSQDSPSFVDAYRLLRSVQHFIPLFDEIVPQISILREFIGGSAFKY